MDDASGPDGATLALLGLAAAIAAGEAEDLRSAMSAVLLASVPPLWVEELVLQSVLMVGWPRTLNAAAVWRSESGLPAPEEAGDTANNRVEDFRSRGEATCRIIYGSNYERLRHNVRQLHPALDQWMVAEGYGRTLSRPGLDLRHRELCTVVQCAVQGVLPQLHSHLRGARHAGASAADLRAALAAAAPAMSPDTRAAATALLERVLA